MESNWESNFAINRMALYGERLQRVGFEKGLFLQHGQDGQDGLSLGQDGLNMPKMAKFGWLFERHFERLFGR